MYHTCSLRGDWSRYRSATAPLRLSRFLATCAFAPCVLVREGAMVKSRTKDQEDELKDLQTRFNFLGTPPSSAPR